MLNETFAVAWRRLDDVPAEALPWLYGVARRVLSNQFRTERRREALFSKLAAQPATPGIGPADPADIVDERAALLASLAALKPDDREVLMLVAWEGLDTQQGATALGISPDAFTARLHRARRRLQYRLEASSESPEDDPGRTVSR